MVFDALTFDQKKPVEAPAGSGPGSGRLSEEEVVPSELLCPVRI